MIRLGWAGAALAVLPAASCSPGGPVQSASAPPSCLGATVDQLWDEPSRFDGRRVCVAGFLGRMVAYGEDSAELYGSKDDAEERHTPRFLVLGLPLTLSRQAQLPQHSTQLVLAWGVFAFEPSCVMQSGRIPAGCRSYRPARLRVERLTFSDGNHLP